MIEARAPGKLVITGEYAVLQGAPAIAMAVDVQASARITASNGPSSVFIDRPTGERYPFEFSETNRVEWTNSQPGQRGAIVEAVFGVLLPRVRQARKLPPITIELNTDAFFREIDNRSCKLGLGSSAAVLVALVGAAANCLNLILAQEDMQQIAVMAHHEFQGVRGSGVDVLTALSGGIIAAFPVSKQGNVSLRKEILSWPAGLEILAVWSGASAATPDLLGRFYTYRDRDPTGFAHHMSRLAEVAAGSVTVWRAGDVPGVMNNAACYAEVLQAMDADAGIGIDTDSHRHVRECSRRRGAVYKTSGAGGGDFGLVMSDSPDVIEMVKADLIAQKMLVMETPIASQGLIIRQRTDEP
jgi:phosphomevalonate kinase